MNATTPHWSLINIGSGNSLVLSGNKPLPEPMLTHISWRHMTSLGHNDLSLLHRGSTYIAWCFLVKWKSIISIGVNSLLHWDSIYSRAGPRTIGIINNTHYLWWSNQEPSSCARTGYKTMLQTKHYSGKSQYEKWNSPVIIGWICMACECNINRQ